MHQDIRYGAASAQLLDVYPGPPGGPTIVWAHGGGWIGGSKVDIGGYFAELARAGFNVVGFDYTLAPEALYPTPVREMLEAIAFIAAKKDEFRLAPDKLILGGDSAGANIAAQAALALVDASYSEELGTSRITRNLHTAGARPVATALQCGVYDARMMREATGSFAAVVRDMVTAYCGTAQWADDERSAFARESVLGNVSGDFPPTFISAGNNDDLTPQSKALAAKLTEHGVEVSALFFSRSARPRTGHEYQFDLSSKAGARNLSQMTEFLLACAARG
ncbi:alpha/beta hydrolase [Rarobacter incanus]|uniref:alpha/beta hydrolase n=1 Tax=Rarobacter incanus TaxID=153494 RepID=UPI0014771F91|nr:alpha/beta hydrolase [Rarobacter incanus]